MTAVAIAKQENYNPDEIKSKLEIMLANIDILGLVRGKKVLIKPNCTGIFSPEEGKTTHPIVLEAVVGLLQDTNADVVIGESSTIGTDTLAAYEKTGVKKVAEKLDVRLIDFKKSRYKAVNIEEGLLLDKLLLPEEVLDVDYVINLAKMKTNYVTRISCSMKNMKGLLQDRDKKDSHLRGVSKTVSDICNYFRNTIAIVDGIVGSELYKPKKGNVLVVSDNMVSCDAVCALIMGINPYDVEHIKLAEQKEVGIADTERIKVYGEDISEVAIEFESILPGLKYLEELYGIKIVDGNPCCSCVGALHYTLEKIEQKRPELLSSELTIGIGPQLKGKIGEGCLLIGNCAKQYKKEDVGVTGCPPTSSMVIDKLLLNS